MTKIFNATQHKATPEQVADGVVDPAPEVTVEIRGLLTFNEIPTKEDMEDRATKVATIVSEQGFDVAMIGGAPYFMSYLENALKEKGVKPVYAFSKREVQETHNPDGTVDKKMVFKHEGFVEV